MKLFTAVAHSLESYGRMIQNFRLGNTPFLCVGLSAIHKAHFIDAAAADLDRPIVLLCQDDLAAARLVSDINAMNGSDIAVLYPSRDFCYRQTETVSGDYEQQRLGVLSRIQAGEARIVAASAQAAASATMSPDRLKKSTFFISTDPEKNEPASMEELIKRLSAAGYARRDQVDGVSQYSVRGGILDLFPPKESNPVRIEYWGDEIDTISYFELDSQRRTDSVETIAVTPAREVLFEEGELIEKLSALIKSRGARKQTALVKETLQKDLDR